MATYGALRANAALRGSGGYGRELAQVRGLAGTDAELLKALETLAPRAGTGIPNLAALQASFGAVAAEIAR